MEKALQVCLPDMERTNLTGPPAAMRAVHPPGQDPYPARRGHGAAQALLRQAAAGHCTPARLSPGLRPERKKEKEEEEEEEEEEERGKERANTKAMAALKLWFV